MVIIIKSTKTPSISIQKSRNPSSPRIAPGSLAVRVARDVPRIGSSHPELPPVKWSAWIEPLNLGSEHVRDQGTPKIPIENDRKAMEIYEGLIP